jgi:hypothetical protein
MFIAGSPRCSSVIMAGRYGVSGMQTRIFDKLILTSVNLHL